MVKQKDIESADLRSQWAEAIGCPLSNSDYEEIRDNLSAFFKLLAEWASESDSDGSGV